MRPYKRGGAKYSSKGKGVSIQDIQLAKRIRGTNPQKKKFQQILQTIPNDGRRMRPEVKVLDVTPTTHLLGNGMILTYLNLVREGTGFWNRVGRKICMKSLYVTGFITPTFANAAALAEDYNRIIVFYDRQANGAPISYDNLIQSVPQDGVTFSSLAFDHVNMNNRERFIILMDRRIVTAPIGINGVTAVNNNIVNDSNLSGNDEGYKITRYIKLQDLETHYLSNSVPMTIADITTGALGILTIAVNATGNSRAYNFNYTTRLKFYDV